MKVSDLKIKSKDFYRILGQLKVLNNDSDMDVMVDDVSSKYRSYSVESNGIYYSYWFYKKWGTNTVNNCFRMWLGINISKEKYKNNSAVKKYLSVNFVNQKKLEAQIDFSKQDSFTHLMREEWRNVKGVSSHGTYWIGAYLETANPKKLTDTQILEIGKIVNELSLIQYELKSKKASNNGKASRKVQRRKYSEGVCEIQPLHDYLELNFQKYLKNNNKKECKREFNVDLIYMEGSKKILCELKSKATIDNARYAVGQLLDYQRKFKADCNLLVVMGEKPSREIFDYFTRIKKVLDIKFQYWDGKTFVSNPSA